MIAFSPHVRIFGLLLWLTQTGNTGGATLDSCCLNARVSLAREACWRLSFSGMTSLGRVLDLIMHRRCCLQHSLLIVPLSSLPRFVLSRSSWTLLLHWDVPPPLAHEVAMSGSCRGVLAWCVVSDVHPAASVCVSVGKPSPSCLVVRPLVVAPPAVRFCVCPGADRCAYSCFAHVCPCVKGRCDRCPLGSGMISDVFVVCFFCAHFIRTVSPDVPRSRVAWLWSAAKNDVRVRRGGLQPASNFFSASVRLLRPSP